MGVDQALDHTGVGEAEERSDDDKTKNFRLHLRKLLAHLSQKDED